MLLIYTIFNVCLICFSKKIYKKWINPLSTYSIIWEICVGLYQSGLIEYYDLSFITWIAIIVIHFIFALGCMFGLRIKQSNANKHSKSHYIRDDLLEKNLKKAIVITLVIASIAIIGNYLVLIETYGTNILSQINNIYSDRISNTRVFETIPYLGSFIYISMVYLGVYIKRYRFTFISIPVFILAYLQSLASGAKGGLVYLFVLFIFGYLSISIIKKRSGRNNKTLKYITFISIVCIFLFIIYTITNARAGWVKLDYTTERYRMLFGDNPAIYKIITYMASPVGVLNKFLEDSQFFFGKNTFLPIYNLLSKIGITFNEVSRYQTWYYTPIHCNVGTWIREIIEDFTFVGAILVSFIFGAFVSNSFIKVNRNEKEVSNILVYSMLMLLVVLAFFVWDMRDANIWIAIIFGYFIGKKVERDSSRKEYRSVQK